MAMDRLLRNKERFEHEAMQGNDGERVMWCCADGEVMVTNRYAELAADGNIIPKRYRMSVFATDRRIVAYQANGSLRKDLMATAWYEDLTEIHVSVTPDSNGSMSCITEFVCADGNPRSRTIMFRLDAPRGDEATIPSWLATVVSVSRTTNLPIDDYSNKEIGQES